MGHAFDAMRYFWEAFRMPTHTCLPKPPMLLAPLCQGQRFTCHCGQQWVVTWVPDPAEIAIGQPEDIGSFQWVKTRRKVLRHL